MSKTFNVKVFKSHNWKLKETALEENLKSINALNPTIGS